jgi:hypothetical protein
MQMKAASPAKKRVVVPRKLVNNVVSNANANANKKRILEALKMRVASSPKAKKAASPPKMAIFPRKLVNKNKIAAGPVRNKPVFPAVKKKRAAPKKKSPPKPAMKALIAPAPAPILAKSRIDELKAFVKDNGVEVIKTTAPVKVAVVAPTGMSVAEKRRQLEKNTYRIYDEMKKKNKNAYNERKAMNENLNTYSPNLEKMLENARTQAAREARK